MLTSLLKTKEIQQEVLSLMKKVHDFCVENDIQYSLEGGSLIGAIRHKGFIPWDDDIDIMMTRPNFDKFCRLFQHEELDIMIPGQKGYYLKFARVLDNNRTIVKEHIIPFTNRDTGIWIDIFPIDSAPEDESKIIKLVKKAERLKLHSWRYRHNLYTKQSILTQPSLHMKFKCAVRYLMKCVKIFVKHPTFMPLEEEIQREAEKIKMFINDKSKVYLGLCFAHNKYTNMYPKQWFESYSLVDFEDTSFYIISRYDGYLKMVFGDYMVIPPKEKQITHNFFKVFQR